MAPVGVAHHVQWQLGRAHGVDGSSEVLAPPVQVVHAEPFEAGRSRAADAAVVQRHHGIALGAGKLGEAAIEALRNAGCAGHDQVSAGFSLLGRIAGSGDSVAVRGGQGQVDGLCGLANHGHSSGRCIFNRESRAWPTRAMGSGVPAARACNSPPS